MEWICGPQDAPLPTPSPAGKGKCDIRSPPKSQGARSCNPKHNDEAWPHSNPDCAGNGKCSTCRKHTTSFNGNSWKGFCMDPDDEKK